MPTHHHLKIKPSFNFVATWWVGANDETHVKLCATGQFFASVYKVETGLFA